MSPSAYLLASQGGSFLTSEDSAFWTRLRGFGALICTGRGLLCMYTSSPLALTAFPPHPGLKRVPGRGRNTEAGSLEQSGAGLCGQRGPAAGPPIAAAPRLRG